MNRSHKDITEILQLAKFYIQNLEGLKTELTNLQKQFCINCLEAENNIKYTFSSLKSKLEIREKELLEKAEIVKNSVIEPLKHCEEVINCNIKTTNILLTEGPQILRENDSRAFSEFVSRAEDLGHMPEIPAESDLPYLVFLHEPLDSNQLEFALSGFGEVISAPPVQIKSIVAKPSALLVEWHQPDSTDDHIKYIKEFKLQKVVGNVLKNKNLSAGFSDCYIGSESQYLLREIMIKEPYSFRVSCKFDGAADWSPWSAALVGSTTLPGFSFKKVNGVTFSLDEKIVSLGQIEIGSKVLFSNGPQVSFTDSVDFTILEADSKSTCILAITTKEIENCKDLRQINDGVLIDSDGKISMSGTEKSMVLSNFYKGLKVSFLLQLICLGKIRVHMDCNDKRVTYDWLVGDASSLYFACQLPTNKWKIMVD
ncbi:cytokine receptor-like factor 3 [Dendroctonus ponderosae]|uniref:cytokine receptor-like factor 3 n=1 Tax=Dendroctonus ponderosae TaxID=77166 RepID=UPI0020362AD6|nr:cytokine receptor-like factor 3 [Dendroctonus ponderosae]KAH1012857.1 hypothetical protein HUJ05_011937 [Dendroctonus ponderosae]